MSDLFRIAAAALFFANAAPTLAQDAAPGPGNAGAYLAARVASAQSDYVAAAEWWARALAADPDNTGLQQGFIAARLGLGDFAGAAGSARVIIDAGVENPAATLVLVVSLAAADDPAGVMEVLKTGSVAPAIDDILAGWAEVGRGRMTEGLARFDAGTKAALPALAQYQKALALASVGDFEGAAAIFKDPLQDGLPLGGRAVVAHLQILSQLERNADALALFDRAFGGMLESAELADLRRNLEAGAPVAFDRVADARSGMAEAFFNLSEVLIDDTGLEQSLAFAQAALHLVPDEAEYRLAVATRLDQLGQHGLAARTYAQIPADSPARLRADLGRADALRLSGDIEGGLAVLGDLAAAHPDRIDVQRALGDALRREARLGDALKAYDAAIALLPDPVPDWSWPLHYSRAICLEGLDRFDEAVTGFRQAIALNPDQPQVLNYLGYSWIDRGENLDEALAMIAKAVKLAPDQGYIIDSLAWAYFRLGRYGEALAPMERASLLEPVDPIVTDHLGDVYWMNGRQLEARFQWRRALSFEPEEADAERIRLKLEKGLDAVMEAEAAQP